MILALDVLLWILHVELLDGEHSGRADCAVEAALLHGL
jgi:hypothetical protein